jgi:hypothetical protein
LNLLRQSSDAVIVEDTTPPIRRLAQLTIDGANNAANETILMPSGSSIDKLTIVINMPSIVFASFEYDTTSAPPVTNWIESGRETANSLSEVGVWVDCPFIVWDCIVDASSVLDSVGQVSQGNIEGPVTWHRLFVHLDSEIQLTDVFE